MRKHSSVFLAFLMIVIDIPCWCVSASVPDIRVEPTELSFIKHIWVSRTSEVGSADSRRINYSPDAPAAPGEILVKFRSGTFRGNLSQVDGIIQTSRTSVNAILAQLQVHDMARVFTSTRDPLGDVYRLRFAAPVSLPEALDLMAGDPDVEWVEPNYLSFINTTTPNDPELPIQWGLAKIQADLAWDICRGDAGIVIAVVDLGVDYNHHDLAANIWHNPGEIPGNGADDDGNGFVDDDIGWDFVENAWWDSEGEDPYMRDRDPMDHDGHGTHCAGIASAVTDNGAGIAGTGWNCRIMALRAGSGDGLLDTDTAAAIEYAANNNAHVISMSWGSFWGGNTNRLAIEYARSQGCVLVAAAGNDGGERENYPAAYPGVIAVAASDPNDNRALFSNYGDWVDIAAPGTSIYSTIINDSYGMKSGTSMATPCVAGVAGLILSRNPTLTAEAVRERLISSADDVGWDVHPTMRLNAYEALRSDLNILTVYNDGDGMLNVTGISPENASPWLKPAVPDTFIVPPGGSQIVHVSVEIEQMATGIYTDRLLIYSDDPDENPYPGGIHVTLDYENNPPSIISMVANPNPVNDDHSSAVTVAAQDIDGNPITYSDWHATCGTIVGGVNNVATYYPPDVFQQTICTVSVTANDGFGNSDNQSVDIIVNDAHDSTPPSTPVVTDDGDYVSNLMQLHGWWTASDSQSGIREYMCAIGTTPGGTDVLTWTSMGTDTEGTFTGLSLHPGKYHYFSVKAQNNAGLWSDTGVSDGILVGTTCHVATTGSDATGDGSVIKPYRTIQRGIDSTSDGCVVLMANGTYTGEGNRNLDFGGRTIIVRSENGPESCIIDCEDTHRGFSFHNGEGPDSVVDGFTIQNGCCPGYASSAVTSVLMDSIRNPGIDRDEALELLLSISSTGDGIPDLDGSGISYNDGRYQIIPDNIVGDDVTDYYGGGIICSNSSPTIKNNTIIDCLASLGGGIYCGNSSSRITNNTITSNVTYEGGGIACSNSSLTITNNTITNNLGLFEGGGILCIDSSLTVTNNTIADNDCWWYDGGGIYSIDSAITIANTILWGNAPEAIYLSPYWNASTVTASYLDIQGGPAGIVTNDNGIVDWGDGNIDADPLFADALNRDYHLTDCSPCNAAGTNNGAPEADMEGNRRPSPADTNPDMGAYEIAKHPVELQSVFYDVLNTTLIFEFDCHRPIRSDLIRLDAIGMEIGDSGERDIELYNAPCLTPDGIEPSHKVAINIQCAYPAPISLALAAFVTRQKVDILIDRGAFMDIHGNRNKAVLGTDNRWVQMITDGLILGTPGDVTGDGGVDASDATLILQASVNESMDIFPIHDAASHVSEWLAGQGYPCDVAVVTADVSGDGNISAYDAALALQQSGGFAALTPGRDMLQRARRCRLSVNSYNERKLEVSIDLDDVSGVYSADIVMNYDPRVLAVADVSTTPAITGWLLEYGPAHGSAPLRISLAGASQPVVNGPFITVNFDILDAGDPGSWTARNPVPGIMSLDIVEFRLNDGMLRTSIESLPESFVLLQNYPNPFNPETWIPYQLSEPANVSITIHNVNGQMVRKLELGNKMPGYYVDRSKAAYWDGMNEAGEQVSSGIYFCTIQAGKLVATKKIVAAR